MFALTTSCDEFPPVNYDNPEEIQTYDDEYFNTAPEYAAYEWITVADLKSLYNGSPVNLGQYLLKAQVVSSDQQGNLYRTMYIQDETGGIELKMGTRNLYNEYKLGQWIYVDCSGLAIGNYGGMIQLGYPSSDSQYETAYIDVQYIIDTHIFRGEPDTVNPTEIDASGITDASNLGKYVLIKGLEYGNQIFAIIYDDNDNSLYLGSGKTWGVTTWAISEAGFVRYMENGRFDGAVAEEDVDNYTPSNYNVSQYFTLDGVDLQVRTSGYSRFADTQIDERILDGSVKVNLTGILTRYNTNNQFLLNDLNGVEIVGGAAAE